LSGPNQGGPCSARRSGVSTVAGARHTYSAISTLACALSLKVCDRRGNAERPMASAGKIAEAIRPQCDIDSMLRGPERDLLYACRVVATRPKSQRRYEANCFLQGPFASAQVVQRRFRALALARRIVGSAGGAVLRVYYQDQAAVAGRIHLREFDLEHRAVFDIGTKRR
jgi:hypothetical protein